MSWIDYLTNALVAGLLAASTNELAIYTIVHHILPRKKGVIARRIRDIVATDLMSPEKMRRKLDEPVVGDVLRRHTRSALNEFTARDLPAPETLFSRHRQEFAALSLKLRDTLLEEIGLRCAAPDFAHNVIRPFLENRWRMLAERTPRSLFDSASVSVVDFAERWTAELELSEPLRRNVRRIFDDWLENRIASSESLAQLLPSAMVAAAEEIASAQAPTIAKQLIDTLRQRPIQDAMRDAIMQSIGDQLDAQGVLGDIKGVFVNVMRVKRDVEGVVRRLPDTLTENAGRPENMARFSSLLRDAVRNGLAQAPGAHLRSEAGRAQLVDLVMGRVWRHDNFVQLGIRARGLAESAMDRPLAKLLAAPGIESPVDSILDEAADRCREVLASPATREFLARQYDELVAFWLRQPLGRLDRFLTPETISRLADAFADEGRMLLRERLGEFAEEADVWDIVTTSIEGYDNRQIAGLIHQLARGELRWVTILGGVIGVVVGLAQTFIRSLV